MKITIALYGDILIVRAVVSMEVVFTLCDVHFITNTLNVIKHDGSTARTVTTADELTAVTVSTQLQLTEVIERSPHRIPI